jgi:hypothetical protein
MVMRPYRRVIKATKEEHGHKPDCVFVDNHGPSCVCDGSIAEGDVGNLVRKRLIGSMELTGWTLESQGEWLSFTRRFGEHVITIARVHSGWSCVWMRGMGWTISESRGFGSLAACVTDLWEHIISYQDTADEMIAETMQLRIAAAKASPTPLTSVPLPEDEE